MNQADPAEVLDFALALIHTRQNVSPKRLGEPGPQDSVLRSILAAAAAAPDHGQLTPWRFVAVPTKQRSRLADVFVRALTARDPQATPSQREAAQEKAYRSPFLLLAVVRLGADLAAPNPDGSPGTPPDPPVGDAERLVSLGCAIQNIILAAHAAGFGTGLTSGQAMDSDPMRALFDLQPGEQAVCCINIGSVAPGKHSAKRLRPDVSRYFTELD